jgi:hypothetical protein
VVESAHSRRAAHATLGRCIASVSIDNIQWQVLGAALTLMNSTKKRGERHKHAFSNLPQSLAAYIGNHQLSLHQL